MGTLGPEIASAGDAAEKVAELLENGNPVAAQFLEGHEDGVRALVSFCRGEAEDIGTIGVAVNDLHYFLQRADVPDELPAIGDLKEALGRFFHEPPPGTLRQLPSVEDHP